MKIHEDLVRSIRVLSQIFYSPPSKLFLEELADGVLDEWPDYVDPCNILGQAMKESIKTEDGLNVLFDFMNLFASVEHIGSWDCAYTDKNNLLLELRERQIKVYCVENNMDVEFIINEPNEYIGVLLFILSERLNKVSQNTVSNPIGILIEEFMRPWIKLFIVQIEENANTEYYLGAAALLDSLIVYLKKNISNTQQFTSSSC